MSELLWPLIATSDTPLTCTPPPPSVPPDLCLLGCVFLIVDYQHCSTVEELKTWVKVINQYGGEVEQTYSPRVTHILCLQLKNAIVQSVSWGWLGGADSGIREGVDTL